MVVYHAITTYQFLECIEHRRLFEGNENAVLLVPVFFTEKNPHYMQLVKYNFFDKIIPVPYHRVSQNKETVFDEIDSMFDSLIGSLVAECDKFYLGGYQYYFSLYLIGKDKYFSIFEEAAGALSRIDILRKVDKRICETRFEIMEKLRMYDTSNPHILQKYCDVRSQQTGFDDERAVHFDVVDNFGKLSEQDKTHILEFFGLEEKIECEESTLILSQHFCNLGLLSFEEHINIYKMFVDYFLDGEKLLFKLHPDDIMYYTKIFPGAKVISKNFPSELIPYVFEKVPPKIATISSTGYNLINTYFKESFTLDFEYEHYYIHTHKYYVLTSILKYLNICKAELYGVYKKLFEAMLDVQNHVMECVEIVDIESNKEVCIVDEYNTDRRDDVVNLCQWLTSMQHDLVVFLNSNQKYCFYDPQYKDVFNNLYIVEICLQGKEKMEVEYIYLYSTKKQIVNMMKKFSNEKRLAHEEKELSANLVNEKEMQIKILEGKLKAVEKRLLQYIEKEEVNK